MNEYSITVFSKKYQISKNLYFAIIIPVLVFWIAYCWCLFGGVWRFGENYLNSGWLSMIPALIIFSHFEINGVHYSLLPKHKYTSMITRIVSWSAILYYLYIIIL